MNQKPIQLKKPRHQSDRPRSAPRPIEKWFRALLEGERWEDAAPDPEWAGHIRLFVEARGCRLILDLARHWRESVFCYDYLKKGPAILAGAKGRSSYAVTTILHELGHFTLWSQNRHPRDTISGEEEAWKLAERFASDHRFACVASIRRAGLYSYRLREMLAEFDGSKRKTRQRPNPNSWKMEDSKKSAMIAKGFGTYSTGKKGKRHQKRFLKKSARRAERRRPIPDE